MGKNKFRLFDRIRPITFNINISVPNSSAHFPFLPLMSQPHRDKMKFYSGAYIKRMTLVNGKPAYATNNSYIGTNILWENEHLYEVIERNLYVVGDTFVDGNMCSWTIESQSWNPNINTYDFTLSNASSERINKSMFDLLKHFTYIDENGIEIASNIKNA
jgi:hypothetical protein